MNIKSIVVALSTGFIVFILSVFLSYAGSGDFTWTLQASKILFEQGLNPYELFPLTESYPLNDFLYYPLYTVVFSSVFRGLDYAIAGPLFISVASAVLAFSTYERKHRLIDVMLTFTNINFFSALYYCQWSILLAAVPVLWFLKPTIGIISFANIRKVKYRILSFFLLFVALVLTTVYWPWWIESWIYIISNFKNHIHRIPIVQFPFIAFTFIFLITRLHAWPLILSALVPQSLFFYDQLVYWGFAHRTWEKVVMHVVGWIGITVFAFTDISIYTIVVAFTIFPSYLIYIINSLTENHMKSSENILDVLDRI